MYPKTRRKNKFGDNSSGIESKKGNNGPQINLKSKCGFKPFATIIPELIKIPSWCGSGLNLKKYEIPMKYKTETTDTATFFARILEFID